MWIMKAAQADAGQRTGPRKREAGGDLNDTRITLTPVAEGKGLLSVCLTPDL
jgi:hypothetical protein